MDLRIAQHAIYAVGAHEGYPLCGERSARNAQAQGHGRLDLARKGDVRLKGPAIERKTFGA